MSDDKKVIFSMSGVNKTYQSTNKQVLKNIYLSFFYGAKIGILGLNGSGKSTLLKIIAGVEKNFQGDVTFSPGYKVGYLEQEPQLDPEKTVMEIVKEGVAETVAILDEYNKINELFGLEEVYSDADKMDKLMAQQADLQDKIDASNAWELDTKLEIAMDALRTPDSDKKIGVLSGGEKRRVALCRLLLQEPEILLLDEPTNHLDAESVHWLEHHLAQYKGTVIAVTHDRYFLDNVAGWILELDRGEGIPWKGNYSSWLDQKSKRLAQESNTASKRQKTLERELEWVRQGAKGRQTKQKARLKSYERLMSQDQKQQEENLEIFIPNGPRLGTNVIEASGVSKAYGDKLLYENLAFNLPQAGIVGIIGPNGAGKTTIVDLTIGLLQPKRGEILVDGTPLRDVDLRLWRNMIGYVPQDTILLHDSILHNVTLGDPKLSISDAEQALRAADAWEFVSGLPEGLSTMVGERGGKLSGGQRQRIVIARALVNRPRLLILDEATSALDRESEDAICKTLGGLKGQLTILAISHNRAMVQAADYVYRMTDGTASLLPKEERSVLAK